MKRALVLATLFLSACRSIATEDATDSRIDHAMFVANAPAAGPGWTFNGGDGTRYADASGACKAFADSYQSGLSVDRLDDTATKGTKTCWVKAPEDSVSSQSTLVMLEGEDGAVGLADANGLGAIEAALVAIAQECENAIGQPTGNQQCNALGTLKHACAAAKIGLAQDLKGGPPSFYSGPAFDRRGDMFGKLNPDQVPPRIPRTEAAIEAQAKSFFASGNSPYATIGQAIAAAKRGKLFPDVVLPDDPAKRLERGNVEAIYDFKFPCPPTKQASWGHNKSTGKRQDRAYDDALKPNHYPKRIQP